MEFLNVGAGAATTTNSNSTATITCLSEEWLDLYLHFLVWRHGVYRDFTL